MQKHCLARVRYEQKAAQALAGFTTVPQFRKEVINHIAQDYGIGHPAARARFNRIQHQYLFDHPEHRKLFARPAEDREEFAV